MIDLLTKIDDQQAVHQEIESFTRFMNCLPEEQRVDCPNKHYFAPGVYVREMFIPAGTFIIGRVHKTSHINIMLQGEGKFIINGEIVDVKQGDIFNSDANVRKVCIATSDVRFLNVFPVAHEDVEELEKELAHEEPEPTKEELEAFNEITNGGKLLCQWE